MKHLFSKLALTALVIAVPTVLSAHEYKLGEIEIGHPYSRAMLPMAKVGGGYLKLTNNGPDDRLIGGTSDRAGSVEVHEMKIDRGIMIMREMQGGIAVPANSTVELKPGSYHIMFMDVAQPFKEGEKIKASLNFEKAGSIDVEFVVRPVAGNAPEMNHDHHGDAHGEHGK
jgi:copper(I)-binding protein